MTNYEYLLRMFALAVECEHVVLDRLAEIDLWSDALDACAYIAPDSPSHDAEMAAEYDAAVRYLQRAIAEYDEAVAARDMLRGRLHDLVTLAAHETRD